MGNTQLNSNNDFNENPNANIINANQYQQLKINHSEESQTEESNKSIQLNIIKTELTNNYVFNQLSRRVGTITNKDKPLFRVAYIGFDDSESALKFISWLKTQRLTFNYRESERLKTKFEVKVWGLNKDIIKSLAIKDVMKEQEEEKEMNELINLFNSRPLMLVKFNRIIQILIYTYIRVTCFPILLLIFLLLICSLEINEIES